MNILDEIIAHKKKELTALKERINTETLYQKAIPLQENNFIKIFSSHEIAFICEVKKASPSKGIIRENFSPVEIAGIYEKHGGSAISVLTDEKYFMGKLEYLDNISKEVKIPLLRKDFIIDEYQIYEAVLNGASAVLLIAAVLEQKELNRLYQIAHSYHLDVLLETHDEKDMEKALNCGANIIGINNRDLRTFKTSLEVTENLFQFVPSGCFAVSESGINTPEDVKRVFDCGAHGVLVGESLCRESDIGAKLDELKTYRSL